MPKAARKKVVLTDRTLRALKPAAPGARYIVWDAHTPHFGIRVSDKGHKSFVVARRRPGDRHPYRCVLGAYPDLSLADARKAAPAALAAIEEGKKPEDIARERAREEARKRKDTFAGVAEDFIARHASRLRTGDEVAKLVRRELVSRWGERPAAEIRRRDVIEMIDEVVDRGTPYAARHAFAACRKLFNWAIQRDVHGLEANPCAGISPSDQMGAVTTRDRHLSDDELRLVWRATKHMGNTKLPEERRDYPFGTVVRLIILTGQRRDEIARLRWREIDGDVLTIPGSRMKNGRDHQVPLTARAMEILDAAPRFRGGDFVFTPAAGKKPVSGFGKAKARLDRVVGILAREEGREVAPFTLHDLRRTTRTGLAALGVPFEVAERVISHTPPALVRTYDRHDYAAEKKAALVAWEARLMAIVGRRRPL